MKRVGAFFLILLVGVGCSSSNPSHWNKREKGTAIGGASGAIVGGVVGSQSGNTGVGALLGGAAGAGAGALIGNEFDKDDRDDRYRRDPRRY
jgi:uncharacterized protein YcfJ